MRVPITDGSPELIFSARAESTLSCARAPHNLCAVTEASEDHKQAIVTAFDPVEGRGQELFRFDLDLDSDRWFCEISPDGLRLAVSGGPEGPMRILSLRGQPAQLIRAKNLKNMWTLHWAADGKGLFVSSRSDTVPVLFHVDLQGNTLALWKESNLQSSSTVSSFGDNL